MTITAQKNSQDIVVEFPGHTFLFRFSLRAIMYLKDAWDMQTDGEVMQRLNEAQFTDLPAVFAAGFATHHPEISLNDVVTLLDNKTHEELLQTIVSAVEAASPPKKKAVPAAKRTPTSRKS